MPPTVSCSRFPIEYIAYSAGLLAMPADIVYWKLLKAFESNSPTLALWCIEPAIEYSLFIASLYDKPLFDTAPLDLERLTAALKSDAVIP